MSVPLFDQHLQQAGRYAGSSNTEYARPETWHLAIDQQDEAMDIDALDETSSQTVGSSLELRTTAAQRLDQVQQHLTRAAVRNAYQRAAGQSYAQLDSHADRSMRPLKSHPFENQPVHEHVSKLEDKERMDVDDEDDYNAPFEGFHCPFVDCHNNMAPQRLQYLLRTYGRICVHIDCDTISATKHDWLAHITTPHHDLQKATARSVLLTGNDDSNMSETCDHEDDRRGARRNDLCAKCCSYDMSQKYSELEI